MDGDEGSLREDRDWQAMCGLIGFDGCVSLPRLTLPCLGDRAV